MVTEMSSRIRSSLADAAAPLVVLDGDVQGVKHDTVAIDHHRGAEAMVRYLLESFGPTTACVFLGGHETNLDTIDRLNAYKQGACRGGSPDRGPRTSRTSTIGTKRRSTFATERVLRLGRAVRNDRVRRQRRDGRGRRRRGDRRHPGACRVTISRWSDLTTRGSPN